MTMPGALNLDCGWVFDSPTYPGDISFGSGKCLWLKLFALLIEVLKERRTSGMLWSGLYNLALCHSLESMSVSINTTSLMLPSHFVCLEHRSPHSGCMVRIYFKIKPAGLTVRTGISWVRTKTSLPWTLMPGTIMPPSTSTSTCKPTTKSRQILSQVLQICSQSTVLSVRSRLHQPSCWRIPKTPCRWRLRRPLELLETAQVVLLKELMGKNGTIFPTLQATQRNIGTMIEEETMVFWLWVRYIENQCWKIILRDLQDGAAERLTSLTWLLQVLNGSQWGGKADFSCVSLWMQSRRGPNKTELGFPQRSATLIWMLLDRPHLGKT